MTSESRDASVVVRASHSEQSVSTMTFFLLSADALMDLL